MQRVGAFVLYNLVEITYVAGRNGVSGEPRLNSARVWRTNPSTYLSTLADNAFSSYTPSCMRRDQIKLVGNQGKE